MPETILSTSNILLYGRVVDDLEIKHQTHNAFVQPATTSGGGQNKFLQKQVEDPSAQLARIYGFSYEGSYYSLPKPAIFLVHGLGEDAERNVGGDPRAARAPDSPDRLGVATQAHSFADEIKVWSYDKGDFSIRLDIETGPFEQILLEARAAPDPRHVPSSGSKIHLRAPNVRGSHD